MSAKEVSAEKAEKIAEFRWTLSSYDRRRAQLFKALDRIQTHGGTDAEIAAVAREYERLEQLWGLILARRSDPDCAAVLAEREASGSLTESQAATAEDCG